MTGGEDPTTLVDITADGNYLVLSRDRNGEENPGLYLQKTTGGPLILIQHQPKVQTLFLIRRMILSLYIFALMIKTWYVFDLSL